jgi:hypothetical protein
MECGFACFNWPLSYRQEPLVINGAVYKIWLVLVFVSLVLGHSLLLLVMVVALVDLSKVIYRLSATTLIHKLC